MYKTILAPLDGSKRAEAILPHLEQLAGRYKAKVIFLQAIEQTLLFVRPETADIEQKEYDEQVKQAKVYLDGLLKGHKTEKAGQIIMRNFILVVLLVFFSINGLASAAEDDIFEVYAEGRYPMVAGASIELTKNMALFTAKRKAVDLAGRYLSRKSLIEIYELNRDEIYSLAAREIEAEILEEKRQTVGKTSTYRVRIRARVQASDFVKAEMEDTKQAKKEAKESFREEME